MTPALSSLYQAVILDHNARPRNLGPLPGHTHEASEHNPLCGDRVTLRLRIEDGAITAASFEGDGCALSRASASLLTLAVTGRTPDEALALDGELTRLLSPGPETAETEGAAGAGHLGDLTALQGVRDVPARRRCATLPWEALRAALAPTTRA
jgi:nitrogen fixation protein NifU and related proteins